MTIHAFIVNYYLIIKKIINGLGVLFVYALVLCIVCWIAWLLSASTQFHAERDIDIIARSMEDEGSYINRLQLLFPESLKTLISAWIKLGVEASPSQINPFSAYALTAVLSFTIRVFVFVTVLAALWV